MEKTAIDKAREWANNNYFDKEDRLEIQELLDRDDSKEITERFYKELEFGTGGMRSILGMGLNRINKYVVRKASQALATEVNKLGLQTPKIAISYDSRRFSFEFAQETASVFAANNIQSYIYKRLNPVCLLSFSVRYHKAQAGVMITASHNPAQYNGYKVYWDDGAQVIPPYDQNIIDNYYAIHDFSTIAYMPFDQGMEKGLIHWVGEDVENEYLKCIKTKVINLDLCNKSGRDIKIVYTPMHGTGLIPCSKALEQLNLTNYHVVKEQAQPDENFSTVPSPNPENPEAMGPAVSLLKEINADLALASDPDADRIGVAVPHNGEIIFLNGNQLGSLMLHYILTNLKDQNRLPKNSYFVKTIVTTELQRAIADNFGVKTENTLTGFKWICGKVRQYEQNDPSANFIFGTEESFGYLNHDYVRDKDGIAPLALLSEMALLYKGKGMNLVDALNEIYEEYGFYHETLLNLHFHGKEGAEKIGRIMDMYRNFSGDFCGENISALEDYQTQKTKSFKDGSETAIDMPKSNVLGFSFESGMKLYIRPSGTEPKIKFYIMIKESEGDLNTKKEKAFKKAQEFLTFLEAESSKA